MRPTHLCSMIGLLLACVAASAESGAKHGDPRLREVNYRADAVVTVPVQRGQVALVVLGTDEAIQEVASGLGADCSKPESVWCVAAQPGAQHFFIKAKSAAQAPNNLAVVTNQRSHSFRFVVLPDGDRQAPVYRLTVKAPQPATPKIALPQAILGLENMPDLDQELDQLLVERLKAKPTVVNAHYALAQGPDSGDIVPTLVFDDGRFTYLRIPGQRELPAVFQLQSDGSESLVNTRLEGDLLVVDRVSRRLVLRAGQAVVGIWNEAFDPEGAPTTGATTVPGVERRLKTTDMRGVTENKGGSR